jgi:hypothetical protein
MRTLRPFTRYYTTILNRKQGTCYIVPVKKKDASLSYPGHLTPSMLEEELKKIDSIDVHIFIFHMVLHFYLKKDLTPLDCRLPKINLGLK